MTLCTAAVTAGAPAARRSARGGPRSRARARPLAYVGVQVAYCLGLKHEPVLELASVTSGFLLRAVAGGVAAGIALSHWFLLTAGFGSLFVAAGKRYGEALRGERTGSSVRQVVAPYSTSYLRFVWTMAATVVVAMYAQWASEVHRSDRLACGAWCRPCRSCWPSCATPSWWTPGGRGARDRRARRRPCCAGLSLGALSRVLPLLAPRLSASERQPAEDRRGQSARRP